MAGSPDSVVAIPERHAAQAKLSSKPYQDRLAWMGWGVERWEGSGSRGANGRRAETWSDRASKEKRGSRKESVCLRQVSGNPWDGMAWGASIAAHIRRE